MSFQTNLSCKNPRWKIYKQPFGQYYVLANSHIRKRISSKILQNRLCTFKNIWLEWYTILPAI